VATRKRISRRDPALGGTLATASPSALRTAAADATSETISDLSYVAPELRPIAKMIQLAKASFPGPSLSTLGQLRDRLKALTFLPLEAPKYETRIIPGPAGNPDLTIHVINAEPGKGKPAVLHMHGGGYIGMSAKGDIASLQSIAGALDCVIVTVEYRLAPETTYTGSIEDNYTGLRWLYRQAEDLGVDRKRIAVMGESAGGGHAALLALTARDRGEVPLIFQALSYPMLDDRTGATHVPASPIGSLGWSAEENRFGWRCLLGEEPGTGTVPACAVPARHADLKGLPPAFIGVGSIDLFVEEDVEYARRLADAGVATELLVIPGAFHGFDIVGAQTSVGMEFKAAKLAALRRAFAT